MSKRRGPTQRIRGSCWLVSYTTLCGSSITHLGCNRLAILGVALDNKVKNSLLVLVTEQPVDDQRRRWVTGADNGLGDVSDHNDDPRANLLCQLSRIMWQRTSTPSAIASATTRFDVAAKFSNWKISPYSRGKFS